MLSGQRFDNRVEQFDGVHAYATAGGLDVAKLFDSPGDDTFVAGPIDGALFGEGFYNRAKHFEGVHAYATGGGLDGARLDGSTGDDRFYADPIQGALYGSGFYNRAKHFEEVYADAGGGEDNAYLFDSTSADLLQAEADWAALRDAAFSFFHRVFEFDYVQATATSAEDTATVTRPLAFTLDLLGPW